MSATTMASLFRPWAAEKEDNNQQEEIFFKEFPTQNKLEIHQDSTVSTTSSSKPTSDVELQASRAPKIDAGVAAKPSEKTRIRKSKQSIERHQNRQKQHQESRKMKHEVVQSPEYNGANFSSSSSSAFSVKVPSRNKIPDISVIPNDIPMDVGLLERLQADPHLGMLPGCTPGDYMSRYCYPESYDMLASELAMESALIHGIMPSPAQMEEYGRLLQLQEQSMKGGASRKQRPKKYRCPHCQVAFSNNGQLKGHIRIHTGERPFKCEESSCGKTFTRNEELTRHKRIHSGLRPYACASCGKRFGRKDHLKKHARTHQPQYHRQAMLVPFLPAMGHPYPYVYGI